MRLFVLLTGIPGGLVLALHWHWLKDQIVHCMVGEAVRKVWHVLTFVLRRKSDSLFGLFSASLIPDPSAFLNIAMILGGIASLACVGLASPRARGILVASAITAVAVGLSREADRKNSPLEQKLTA